MRRRIFRVLSAVMSVVMLIFSGVTPLSIAALEGNTVDGNAILTIVSAEASINKTPITEGQEVHNGDLLSISLEWSLSNGTVPDPPVTIKYNMADKLKGISINEQEMKARDSEGNIIAIYKVIGQDIYIELIEGHSGRSGSCSLDGVIDLSSTSVDEDGDFEIEYFGKTTVLNAPDTVPAFSASKSAVSFRKSGEKYYQDFEIKVYSTNGVGADNVTVKDIYPVGAASVYKGGITNVQVNGSPVSASVSEGRAEINIGSVSADSSNPTVITYSVEIDGENALNPDQNGIAKENKAEVYYNDTKRTEATGYPSYQTPYISKTGAIEGTDNRKIKWTVTVTPNMLAGTDFTLTDTLDGKLSFADIAPAISGATNNGDGTFTVPMSAFIPTSDGRYELTYYTELDDEYAESISSVSFTNKAKAKFDGYDYEYGTQTSVSTTPTVTDYITKNVKSVSGDVITWRVEAAIPDTNKLGTVKISDSTSEWSEKPGTHTVDLSTLKIFDGNGSLVPTNNAVEEISDNNYSGTDPITWFEVTLKSDFAEANKGKTISFEYNTVIDGVHSLIYKNKANINISLTDGTSINDSGEDIYTAAISADKFVYENVGNLINTTGKINPMGWYVNVYAANHTYYAGDVITITDTIPEGLSYVSGSAKLGISDNTYYIDYSNEANQGYLMASSSGQTVTFMIGLDDALAQKLSSSGGFFASVAYATEMTKEYAGEFNSVSQSKTFTNSAAVSVGGTQIDDVSASQTIESNPKDIVFKGISAQGLIDGDAYARYYIDINKDEAKIGTGDTITVTDKLGSRLDLLESSISISPSDGASYSYNAEARTIEFTLQNSKYYRIEYKVDVRQIGKSETPTEEEINEKFANTVRVEGRGANNVSSVALINDSTYHSTADYVFDENKAYIELSGSKLWDNAANSSLLPAKVKVVIKRTKNGAPDAAYEKTYDITPDEHGDWKFESGSLLTKDSDGTVYAYNVSEVAVEGYTASYKLDGSVISGGDYIGGGVVNQAPQQISFDITNTYTPELGSLTVNKVWAGESAAKPSEITITLTGDDGSSYTKVITVAGTGDRAVFTDIPLKKYSVNSSGEIVSAPINYTISESAAGADAAILANYTLKYNNVEVTDVPVTVTAEGTAVTITNEYNAPAPATGSLTVVKAWEGLTADAVKPGQLIISLYGDGVLVDSKTMNIATENSVIFDNLPINNAGGGAIAYYITESATGADAAILAEYTLKYNGTAMTQVPVTVSDSGSSVTIANVYTPVLGQLAVSKRWSNITADTVKPFVITITLYDLSGHSYTKNINIAGGETSAVFENLPVYKYSVNADNTVTKTPIKYYVIETASGDNAAILANFTAEYPGTDDTVSGKRIFNLECAGYNKAVDILNTYNGGGTGSSSSVTTTASDTTTTTTTTTVSDTTTTTTTTTASDTTTTTTTTTVSDTTTTTTTTTASDTTTTTTTTTASDTTTTTTTVSDTTTTTTTTTVSDTTTTTTTTTAVTTPETSRTIPSTIPVRPVITTTTATTPVTTTTTTAATTPETTDKTTNTTRPPEEDEDEIET